MMVNIWSCHHSWDMNTMSIQESYDTKAKTDILGKTNVKRKLISIPKVVIFLNLFNYQTLHT